MWVGVSPPPQLMQALQVLRGDEPTSCLARLQYCRPGSVLAQAAMPGAALGPNRCYCPNWSWDGRTICVSTCLRPVPVEGRERGALRRPVLAGAGGHRPSHPVPLLSLQMRWLPPSEAGSQGWKSRQFC